ncbi:MULTISPECIES: tautomerase family protein [Shinella]|uniref:4-oxalocrotonate tautomerase n=1 Tax=Shinella granuli TaxID=323621 RepID=A0A4R2D9Z7_SHIGR|nr:MULTISPECIES: tautomerase family protein [Shinella]ANH04466.1 4-oxalocrotonate tautomerase [Shinella sp. HZN7]TCN48779.1 4-oxalocrotonate tautomerase [Shinella granuli]
MPHVILKMVEGRTEEQKKALAEALTRAVTTTLGCGEDLVSVAIEDFKDAEWMARVYVPDIQQRPDTIYRMPGYGPED